LRVFFFSHRVPPPNGFYRKGRRASVHSHTDPSDVLCQIIDAVRRCASKLRYCEIMNSNLLTLPLRSPFLPIILEITHQFFLFGVHRNDWLLETDILMNLGVDMFKLRVAIQSELRP
jgi:hypothetical protein